MLGLVLVLRQAQIPKSGLRPTRALVPTAVTTTTIAKQEQSSLFCGGDGRVLQRSESTYAIEVFAVLISKKDTEATIKR